MCELSWKESRRKKLKACVGADGASPAHSLPKLLRRSVAEGGRRDNLLSFPFTGITAEISVNTGKKKEQGATNPLWLLSHLCFFYHSKAWIHMNTGSLTPRIARLSALREAPKTTRPNSFRLFRGWLWMPKEVKESTHLFTFPYF